jgi:hypothetical protein
MNWTADDSGKLRYDASAILDRVAALSDAEIGQFPREVCKLLVQQVPATPVPDEYSSVIIEDANFESLDASQWREVQGPSQDEIKSEMRRRTALIDELSRQLDALNS